MLKDIVIYEGEIWMKSFEKLKVVYFSKSRRQVCLEYLTGLGILIVISVETLLEDYNHIKEADGTPVLQELSLEEQIKTKHSLHEVVMLEWNIEDALMMKVNKFIDDLQSVSYVHAVAQSYKGFSGYVYQKGAALSLESTPVIYQGGAIMHPVAVLFKKGE